MPVTTGMHLLRSGVIAGCADADKRGSAGHRSREAANESADIAGNAKWSSPVGRSGTEPGGAVP